MAGIDNNFVNRYIEYKKDGISTQELEQIKKDTGAQSYTTEAAHALTREIIKDGKIDQDEQKVLQAIGQGAKDITVAQQYASSIDPTNSEISKLIMLGFKNKIQSPPSTSSLDVSKMGNTEKIMEAFKGSLKYVGPELRAKLEQMLTPDNLKLMAAGLAVYATSHAVGAGFIADGALFLLGAVTLGKDAVDVAKKLYGFSMGAIDAKTPQDLDNASRDLAQAMATVISDLPALIGMKNAKISSGSVSREFPTGNTFAFAGGAVLDAKAVITITYPVIQLTKVQAAAIGATVMMAKGHGPGNNKQVSSSENKPAAKTGPNGTYEDAPYHSSQGNSVKSKKPVDGQSALDKSVPLGGTSKRRIAFVNDEIVILDQTSPGKFHGHVRTWDALENDMRAILIKNKLFKPNGKPVK